MILPCKNFLQLHLFIGVFRHDVRFLSIKVEFVGMLKEMRPDVVITGSCGRRRDGLKFSIKDDVILWRYFTHVNIEDKRNQGRVFLQETNKDAETSLGIPFWKFRPIFNFRREDKERKLKYMSLRELRVGRMTGSPKLFGSNLVSRLMEGSCRPKPHMT